jgi:uncharacterized phage protein (TIGR02216 family)
MTRIAWGGLMRLGMVELRLSPEVFWGLTPAELMLIGLKTMPEARVGVGVLVTRKGDDERITLVGRRCE